MRRRDEDQGSGKGIKRKGFGEKDSEKGLGLTIRRNEGEEDDEKRMGKRMTRKGFGKGEEEKDKRLGERIRGCIS